ncbi:MAG: energy transducer TonB [Flavobacteriales bacterium]
MSAHGSLMALWGFLLCGFAHAQVDHAPIQRAGDRAREQWESIAVPARTVPVDTAHVYSSNNEVERMPEFPGGMKALYKRITDEFQYSDPTRSIGGRIYVQFVVERTGEVGRVKVLRGLDETLDREAVRVISGLPRWSPALYFDGTPVACRMVLPIVLDPK